MSEQETQRLFFALWPDAEVRLRLERAALALKGVHGRRVALENLHITLAFLGSLSAAGRACAEAAAAAIYGEPFTLVLDRLGAFPRARVVWLGASEVPPALAGLAVALNAGLAACGLEPDPRPYRPHVTVLRKVSRPPPPAELAQAVGWPVREFVLVESRTLAQGAEYRVLERWTLGSGPAG